MPGLPGDDRVERTAFRVPIFELADLDLDSGPLGDLGHPRVWFHAEYRAAGRPVLPCPDASAAADIQELETGAGGDDALYQRLGIARPCPVVSFGVHSEGLRYRPELVQLLLGKRRGVSRHGGRLPPTP